MLKPQINVTPLIDVLLVLLIIFMVITPMKPSSFESKIPQEPTNDARVRLNPDTIVVTVGLDSVLRLNKEQTAATVETPGAVIARLREIFNQRQQNLNNERTVFIKAPKRLDYGSVVKVVDALKASGAQPISLQIDALE